MTFDQEYVDAAGFQHRVIHAEVDEVNPEILRWPWMQRPWRTQVVHPVRLSDDRIGIGKARRFYGLLPRSLPDFDIDLCRIRVRTVDPLTVAVDLFPKKPCGCVTNFGGWTVRECQTHERESNERLADARCEHDIPLSKNCGRCWISGADRIAEDRQMIAEAQGREVTR